jgi:hypothetical protein
VKNDIRWKQRFENFERAFGLLQEAFARDPEQVFLWLKERAQE